MEKFAGRLMLGLFFVTVPLVLFSATRARVLGDPQASDDSSTSAPWSASQTVLPKALAAELSTNEQSRKPIVVCVGFHPLYEGAHVPGASFHGAASTPKGIADLKDWAQSVPRAANVVLYCGCCPLERCPNLKPAFVTLRDMGFTNLRVLLLPNDFNTDWIEKGYAVEKGK